MSEKRSIYMDYSATTPTKKEVIDEMMPYFGEAFGNASSIHSFGRTAKTALSKSRETIASFINASADEIFFTSGGTESDNWAIRGYVEANKSKGNHIITTTIEHHAVLHPCESLRKEGYDVTFLEVDEYGMVSMDSLRAAIKDTTILISIMFVNNEIGTIQPIEEIGKLAKEKGIAFHTDAVQALGNVEIDVNKLGIDMMSASGHKIYGPKGVGFLYVRKGIKIANLIEGGAQERRRRAGTENMPGIVGLAKAVEMARDNFDSHVANSMRLRDSLIEKVLREIPYTRLNGHRTERHPGNTSFCFEFIEGESLLLSLDILGIAGSSGSACTSGSLDPSHVLLAIGLPHEIAHGSLRLSLGDFNTEDEIDYVVDSLKTVVARLRGMSPLYERKLRELGQQ